MSYANVIMYSSVIPSYNDKKKDSEQSDNKEVINADDPKNKELVRQHLFS